MRKDSIFLTLTHLNICAVVTLICTHEEANERSLYMYLASEWYCTKTEHSLVSYAERLRFKLVYSLSISAAVTLICTVYQTNLLRPCMENESVAIHIQGR